MAKKKAPAFPPPSEGADKGGYGKGKKGKQPTVAKGKPKKGVNPFAKKGK